MKVAGLGFRQNATVESLRALLSLIEAQSGPVSALATLPAKTCAPALRALAAERGLPVHAVAVHGVVTPTQSARIMALHGTGSVAEAAALVCAGKGARLVMARVASGDGLATCAVAISEGEAE
ncbi:MAG: cobalamin biosynthesis protein [Paracoccaceae bacterium]|uniref:cobalamin biosynthesis protein n=1 Tax=Pseudophaeobacter sp. TaxID=1971739 RepID=UPI002636FA2C|nr:cobalamin biosynthesis protein [Pseudophaeobacter sp.]